MTAALASIDELSSVLAAVRSLPAASDNSERVDRLRLLEEIKAAACAAQMRDAVEFDEVTRDTERAAGVKVGRRGRGVTGELGLALRRSPNATQRWLWHAKTLTNDLPDTLAELAAGRTTEWRALLVAKETSVLAPEERAAVDAAIAPNLEGWGDRRVESRTRALAQELDPLAAVNRARRAECERHVTLRPVADAMARLSILAPLAQGVAAFAALTANAASTLATPGGDPRAVDGKPRGRGQIMADTAVERLTGQTVADDVPAEINLLMPIDSLITPDDAHAAAATADAAAPGTRSATDPDRAAASDGASEDASALLLGPPGSGVGAFPIPAGIARRLALAGDAPRWLRRLFTSPSTGRLLQMESDRREFTLGQRRFLCLRDHTCRTPYCDAPVRHADHVRDHARGGATSVDNGQGDCAACNHAKQAPGWHARVESDGTVITTTPTGHAYASPEPEPPGHPDRARPRVAPAPPADWGDLLPGGSESLLRFGRAPHPGPDGAVSPDPHRWPGPVEVVWHRRHAA